MAWKGLITKHLKTHKLVGFNEMFTALSKTRSGTRSKSAYAEALKLLEDRGQVKHTEGKPPGGIGRPRKLFFLVEGNPWDSYLQHNLAELARNIDALKGILTDKTLREEEKTFLAMKVIESHMWQVFMERFFVSATQPRGTYDPFFSANVELYGSIATIYFNAFRTFANSLGVAQQDIGIATAKLKERTPPKLGEAAKKAGAWTYDNETYTKAKAEAQPLLDKTFEELEAYFKTRLQITFPSS